MQFGEALVLVASDTPDGRQEVELDTVCPAANFERLNVVLGNRRVAIPLDRPVRGAACRFKITLPAESRVRCGEKALVEFFYPGEQAGVHCPRRSSVRLNNPERAGAHRPYGWLAG